MSVFRLAYLFAMDLRSLLSPRVENGGIVVILMTHKAKFIATEHLCLQAKWNRKKTHTHTDFSDLLIKIHVILDFNSVKILSLVRIVS